MAVDGRLVAQGLDASAKGRLRIAGSRGPTADMEVKVARANIRSPRSTGQAAEVIPAAVSARLALAEGNISLSDLAGTIAGTDINGRLTVGFADPVSVERRAIARRLASAGDDCGGDRRFRRWRAATGRPSRSSAV